MDPVEENHSLRADRFKQQVVRLDAYVHTIGNNYLDDFKAFARAILGV
ncbi:hypothetical protein [Saccharospirillum impatiens]|nr:hypothetical protein [Saccharospirillum impatiens]